MNVNNKRELELICADWASKLKTGKDVENLMLWLVNDTYWDRSSDVQNFYARKVYRYAKIPEVKQSLTRYFSIGGF